MSAKNRHQSILSLIVAPAFVRRVYDDSFYPLRHNLMVVQINEALVPALAVDRPHRPDYPMPFVILAFSFH